MDSKEERIEMLRTLRDNYLLDSEGNPISLQWIDQRTQSEICKQLEEILERKVYSFEIKNMDMLEEEIRTGFKPTNHSEAFERFVRAEMRKTSEEEPRDAREKQWRVTVTQGPGYTIPKVTRLSHRCPFCGHFLEMIEDAFFCDLCQTSSMASEIK